MCICIYSRLLYREISNYVLIFLFGLRILRLCKIYLKYCLNTYHLIKFDFLIRLFFFVVKQPLDITPRTEFTKVLCKKKNDSYIICYNSIAYLNKLLLHNSFFLFKIKKRLAILEEMLYLRPLIFYALYSYIIVSLLN